MAGVMTPVTLTAGGSEQAAGLEGRWVTKQRWDSGPAIPAGSSQADRALLLPAFTAWDNS